MTRTNRTPQEEFWAGDFGSDYISRNRGDQLLASNLQFFARALRKVGPISSCVELGANIGMNLKALKLLYPDLRTHAVEINRDAALQLSDWIGSENLFVGSIFDWKPLAAFELSLVKGVLIHLNPARLPDAYDKLYEATSRYIMIAEYYNPLPVTISYRGNKNRLFKRDFAGEILDRFSDMKLVDYGFCYHRDPAFPQDDINWFLMEKVRL